MTLCSLPLLSSYISHSYIRFQFLGHGVKVDLFSGSLAILAIFVVSRIIKLVNGLRAVSYMPGMRIPFQPLAPPAILLPTTWWNPSVNFVWLWRYHFYKRFQSENVSFVPFVFGRPVICTSNLDVARQVTSGGPKRSFYKPPTASAALLLWGMNIVAADGEMWRKHRRIIGPAFNNRLYEMVWSETLDTYREMISAEGWTTKDMMEVPVVQKLTSKLALLLIAKCGFGLSFNWSAPPKAPNGSMTIQEAIRIVCDTTLLAIIAPKWLLSLPFPKFRKMREAYDQMMRFMQAQVRDRKTEILGQGGKENYNRDFFTMLVEANEQVSGKFQLDDQELIGNTYIMLFAGHETTAHSLAATIGFLGFHEDIQEEVLEQIHSVVGHDRDPIFEDYAKLDKVLAAFYEALRMFPAGFVMIREAQEDTVLQIPNPPGVEGSTPMPIWKGVQIVVDMVGVQYNPRYCDEPEKYKPSRWYGMTNESEAFSAFSLGPRACLGRKFATTEAVAFLTMLLRDWKIQPMLRKGETKEEWRNRVMDAHTVITLGVKDVPVRFTKRTRN